MSKNITKFVARIPAATHTEIKATAARNGRSMNSEIVMRLQAPLETRQDSEMTDRLETIERLIRSLIASGT